MKHLLYFSLILFGFTACEKTQKIDDYPMHKSKLVANCLFREDSVFEFKLYKSLSPLDNAPFKVLNNANAYVRIYENNVLFDSFRYNPGSDSYLGTPGKMPSAGRTYRFDAFYPGYSRIGATETLPVKATLSNNSNNLRLLKIYNERDSVLYADYELNINLNIDPASDCKYAMVLVKRKYIGSIMIGGGGYNFAYIHADENGNNNLPMFDRLFVENEQGIQNIRCSVGDYYSYLNKNRPYFEVQVEVYKCTKSTYEYLKRYAIQNANTDDPFAEPIPISNNIENGFGVFGGLSKSVYTFYY